MYNVAFRVDGGPSIGMGHIMRCVSLAKMFLQKEYNVYFLTKYEEGKRVIVENGFDVTSLPIENYKANFSYPVSYENIKNQEIENSEMIQSIKKQKTDVLIVDHYNVTQDFFLLLKPHVNKLIYIDDINLFAYPVDMVINGNITGGYTDYKTYSKKQKFLLGPSYNLIRQEFKNIPKRIISKQVKKILVTTGGSDPFRITEVLIDIIRSERLFNEMELHIIIGNSFQNKEEIKEKQKQYKNIVLYENVKKISSVMLDCDIALSSCGSTLYELCACGLPTLGFILADNQTFVADKMNELGYIKCLGWYHGLNKESLVEEIKALIYDFKLREQMVTKQQTLVDGKGTERIVSDVTKLLKEKRNGINE